MDLHLSSSSFFGKPRSGLKVEAAATHTAGDTDLVEAARAIQHWWQKTNLKQTARESSQYLNHIVSLHEAETKTFSDLKAFILNKDTLATTKKLLMHLEQAKDLILPMRSPGPELIQSERVFLSAYLIVTKSEDVFESPTNSDGMLFFYADQMLKSFESLCQVMCETYMEKIVDRPLSPMARSTPSSDQIFANFEQDYLQQSQENMQKNRYFMTNGQPFLEAFHQNQIAYYELFSKWEVNNRFKLAKTLIAQCLRFEARIFSAFRNPDPRVIQLYDGLSSQQEVLRAKIELHLGQEGIRMLNQDLEGYRVALEASKWATAPEEVLLHELAMNPAFSVSPKSCIICSQRDIKAAISAATQMSPDIEPMLDVLEDIREQMILFTPHNTERTTTLRQDYSRKAITEKIDEWSVKSGFYLIIDALLEDIKALESPEHESETVAFQDKVFDELDDEDLEVILIQSIDFIYNKLSQINFEMSDCRIKKARLLVNHNIVTFEQTKFQARLAKSQFNLSHSLAFVDAIVKTPTNYRIDTPVLCSKYISTYMIHAICIDLIQRPGKFDLQAVPETFYLDRVRLSDWHEKYQRIFYTVAGLGIFLQFGASFSPTELLEHKKTLLTILETEKTVDPSKAASCIGSMLNTLLSKKGKSLSSANENAAIQLMKDAFAGNHKIGDIFNKRLGDQLWIYFQKGYLPEASNKQVGLYGAQQELSELGRDILPLLRLHVKVHGAFYENHVNKQMWNPLFAMLKVHEKPTEFPRLLLPEQHSISKLHGDIHKLVFLLSGLTLIKQHIDLNDIWNTSNLLQNSTLKKLAHSSGLLNPRMSEDAMEEALLALMKNVAREQEIPFDDAAERKMIEMLHLAKNGETPGYQAFVNKISGIYRQFIMKGSMPALHSNGLTAEFSNEIQEFCRQVNEIITSIKSSQMHNDDEPVAQVIPAMRSGVF